MGRKKNYIISVSINGVVREYVAKFYIGEKVYVKTDTSQTVRIVTAYYVTSQGVKYELKLDDVNNYYYDIELSRRKNAYQEDWFEDEDEDEQTSNSKA